MFELNIIKCGCVILFFIFLTHVNGCYWNDQNPYLFFGTKTPYDIVRGDIRDYEIPENCQAVSIWNLNRHGNKNPSYNVTMCMRDMAALKDEITQSYEAGSSELCAQDIQNLKKWSWNTTLEVSQAELTGPGYEESYDIAKRIQEKYRHLFQGSPEEYLLRPTFQQRSIVSGMAYIHGLTDGIHLNVTLEESLPRDDVIGSALHCDFYNNKIANGKTVLETRNGYYKSANYQTMRNAVQKRLGIKTKLNEDNVFCIYNLCRYYSSWKPTRQSPWCAAFTNDDLQVLEYYDDVVHYYKDGFGSWVNVELGKTALKDMYESLEAAVNGTGKKLTAYFTHNTMMSNAFTAIGFNKGDELLHAHVINPNRHWRTSYSAAFSANILAVLNRCNDTSSSESYKVQLFINEKETDICPLQGCSWQEFRDKFEVHKSSNLSFCNLENMHEPI